MTWMDDFDVDVPEFSFPVGDATLFKLMPRHEWLAIDAAATAAHQGMHGLAEDCRAKAGYAGLGGELAPTNYWPHDNDPQD